MLPAHRRDENEGKQWDRNPQIQAFMKEKGIKDNHALQAFFNHGFEDSTETGKKMIGWEEILLSRSAAGCRDSVMARTRIAGGRREERLQRILSAGYYSI